MLTNGQLNLGSSAEVKEFVAVPNDTNIATFTDTNLSDTTSSFTATIDWGDGTTTTGSVVGSNGHFTVEGGHTYTDENQFPALVTINDTNNNPLLFIAGTVPVADTDSFNTHGTTITYTVNQQLTDVTVATFTDTTNTSNLATDFSAQIDWGDGTTTTGTVQGSAGSFSVVGSHTYTAAGENTISVAFADDAPDAATGFVTSNAVSGFGGQVTLTSATEGTPLGTVVNPVVVATFADTSGSLPSSDYTANIDWGDETTTTGTVSGANGGPFTVTGSHTYADEEKNENLVGGEPTGPPVMTVTVTRTTDSATIAPRGTVAIADADFLTMHSQTIGGAANQALTSVTVATFSDSYTGQVASDLEATIDWGDGSPVDTVTVSGSGGSFTVSGSHTYGADGQYNVNVAILDDLPTPGQIGSTLSKANIGLIPGDFLLNSRLEGASTPVNVATFTDGNSGDTPSSFNASIDWGDGLTTGGTVSGSNGSFTVNGNHTYADEGDDPVTVTLTRTADLDTSTVTGTVTVGEADNLSVTAANFSGDPGTAINNVQVATFTDAFTGQVAGDLNATINWGDGTSSVGSVSGGGGSFTVDGSHTYTTGGNYTFNVSVADDSPGNASANANGTATINFASQMVLTTATEGTALPNNTPVATFSDSNGGDTQSSFTATIDWGDGATAPGTVVGSGGSFTVEGGHTYADEGSDTAKVTLTHTADQAASTVSGSVAVAEADVLTPHGTSFTVSQQQSFSGTVATFGDSDSANVAGDFTASIDWGDGQTTIGSVSGGNGAFTVGGSHTYATGGQDTVKVTLADDAPGTATATATTTATVRSLSGQMALTSATEGSALPGSTPIATFSDTSTGDQASDFAARIIWGDGTTTAGIIVGGGGSFTVRGAHTYADEGSDTASVTLTHTADQLQTTASGNVAIGEGDVLTPHGTSFTVSKQQSFSGTVATFSDSNGSNVASDFTASIDWGDGFTTTGTVSVVNGAFTVGGTHTYSTGGQDTVKVKLTDDAPGTATATAITTATVRSLSGQMALTSATEGSALPGSTPIATFSDTSTGDQASDFAARIIWGDGTTTAGNVVGSGGSFTVEGGHTYADEGSNAASVTLVHTADQLQTTASGTVLVGEGDILTPHGTSFAVSPNQSFSGTVATFGDSDTGNVAGDFTASIDWGDGQTTTGTVSGVNGSFTVGGSHTYATGGQDTVKVTLADDAPGTATATATTTATVRSLSGQMALTSATEGSALPGSTPVATFSDNSTGDQASDFAARINWGDGTTTAGTVVGSGGSFTVEGAHTYADEGSDPAVVTLTHTADQLSATASGFVTVAEGDVLTPHGTSFTVNPQQSFSGTVATFADSDSANVAGDFTASIDWGDGQTTTGTVSGGNGSFTVGGSHTYAAGGQDTVKVKLTDDAPGTATATATTAATVRSLSGQMALTSATEGSALPNSTPVATFSDTSTGDQASDFAATINWGDGTTTAGTVVGSGGSFTVEGGHTYADEGTDAASVTLTHTADQLQATASGNVAIVEGDVLTPQGANITATAHQAFSGTVATFADSDTANVAGDFTASIDWGDGQTTAGTVSGGNGSFTVGGSHAYAAPGQDSVKVTLADDAPGTATATATTTATVTPGTAVPFDFNADTISDLVFQDEGFNAGPADGTPQIWLWNGTAVTSQLAYINPGASWHVVTSRDVNGDGMADLIWQNTDGTPSIWLMNGTTPTAAVELTNSGPSWQLVASGDTNGDGNSDLIWQNTNGTLGVWLMNGTTPISQVGLSNPGANWKVVGTADYNSDGRDDILLQDTGTGNLMIDLMNGTTITSTKTITVGDPSWHAVSTGEFNGQAEIAWQNSNGTPSIWLMNGTTPAAEVPLINPGPGWQLISIDHFTPGGQADLLFQNTNGAMGLWEMNGTTIAAMVGVPNPGAGWQSENGHPFTA
jgi:FG-GAP-like repeat